MAQNTLTISLEFPAILLNLIKLNAPATANAVPKFPLTKKITTCTKTGNIVKVIKKFGVVLVVSLCTTLITAPNTIATNKQIKQLPKLTDVVVCVKILSNIIYFLPIFK